MCSTERVRKRSTTFRNASQNQHVAIQKLLTFYSGYSLETNSLATQSAVLQNTANITKFGHVFSTQAGLISSNIFFFPIFPDFSITLNIGFHKK